MSARSYFFTGALVLIVGAAIYFLLPAYKDYRQSHNDTRKLEAEISEVNVAAQSLEREIQALRTDPDAVERVAREKFGWCRDNEKVYHFDPLPYRDPPEKPRPLAQP